MEFIKDFGANLTGCFLCVFAAVWVTNPSQTTKPAALAVMCLLAVAGAVAAHLLPGAPPLQTSEQIVASYTRRKAIFMSVGVLAFGLAILAIGWI